MKYIPLFLAIQLVSLVLGIVGLPVCWFLAYHTPWVKDSQGKWHWKYKWAWIYDNQEDGIAPAWYRTIHPEWRLERIAFYWSCRNSVNNLRYVPGVSKVGRPLWYWSNGKYYAKAGWLSDGFPCLSAGAGKGY